MLCFSCIVFLYSCSNRIHRHRYVQQRIIYDKDDDVFLLSCLSHPACLISSRLISCLSHHPRCQLDRLQLILNSAPRAVSKIPRFSQISPILKYLHWLNIDQCIQYKVLSHQYKTLQSQNHAISETFSTFKLTLLLVHLLLSFFSVRQSTRVSK